MLNLLVKEGIGCQWAQRGKHLLFSVHRVRQTIRVYYTYDALLNKGNLRWTVKECLSGTACDWALTLS